MSLSLIAHVILINKELTQLLHNKDNSNARFFKPAITSQMFYKPGHYRLLEAGNLLGTASATSFIHSSIYLLLKNQPQHQLDIHSSESKLSYGESIKRSETLI
ncbi:hypothetical protein NC653_024810 [Populus alba x Populus x berolinensis]|uniref:Uncharacterized protein n=1 Tax=Populus alba x Populus x berolinensis TaxID=444605 RepID=A0AAD6MC37_9ROSI|nr:hypothetical protein NC653_024810 [Populus alba x Populus x berolinensis]